MDLTNFEDLGQLSSEEYTTGPLPDSDVLDAMLSQMCDRWIDTDLSAGEIITLAQRNLEIEDLASCHENWSNGFYQSVKSAMQKECDCMYVLTSMLKRADMVALNDECAEDDDQIRRKQSISQCYRVMMDSVEMLVRGVSARMNMEVELANIIQSFTPTRWAATTFDDADLSPYQEIICYILTELSRDRLRKFGESCYQEIQTEDGHDSHAWSEYMSVKQYIYEKVKKNQNYDMWKKSTNHPDNVERVCKNLIESTQDEFPLLNANRSMFSFENGIYVADQDYFYPFARRNEWESMAEAEREKRQPMIQALQASGLINRVAEVVAPTRRDVAIKFFATEFTAWEYDEDSFAIPTPTFEKLLNEQKFTDHTKRWFYTFIGRLLYEVGVHDGWQVIMFLKGVAGSGKSTVAKYVSSLYPGERVGSLSSNAEGVFGISALYDKLLVVCPEVKQSFSLSQGDLQSMVSGEDVSVAIKHKTAKTVTWKTPMLFCGNELAAWADAAGSMTRRLMVFEFNEKPKDVDHQLFEKLSAEIGNFLRKCNCLYIQSCIEYGHKDIWKPGIISQQMRDSWHETQARVNKLVAFLNHNDTFELCDEIDAYVSLECFSAAYMQWRNKNGHNNHGKISFDEDHYKSVFADKNLSVVSDKRMWEGEEKSMQFIYGIKLKDTTF